MTNNITNGPSLNGGSDATSATPAIAPLSDQDLLAVLNLSPEMKEQRRQSRETSVEPWTYLVQRKHAWRRQLYLKGRKMTARQLIGSMYANQMDEQAAADDYELPVEAVREALAYVNENTELIEIEWEIEQLMLKRAEVALGPQSIS